MSVGASRRLYAGAGFEEGVADAQDVTCTQLEQSLAVLVHLAHTKLSKAGQPRDVIYTYSGIGATQSVQLFFAGDSNDGGFEILVELVLDIRRRGQRQGLHTDKGNGACCSVQAEG